MTDTGSQEFRIGRSKAQHGLVVAGVCVLVGAGVFLLADEGATDQRLMGAVVLLLGLGVGFHAWRGGRSAGAHLRIDPAGLYFREWGATVGWSAIDDVYQSGSRLQPFITIRVRDPEAFLAGLPADQAQALRGNRLWKSPELRIPYNAVEASRDEMLEAIGDALRRYGGGAGA